MEIQITLTQLITLRVACDQGSGAVLDFEEEVRDAMKQEDIKSGDDICFVHVWRKPVMMRSQPDGADARDFEYKNVGIRAYATLKRVTNALRDGFVSVELEEIEMEG